MAIPARVLVARGVGDKVRAHRQARKWSQEKLAREVPAPVGPLSRQTIYAIEAGANVPEWETLEAIAQALDVPFWELMPDRPFFVASQEGGVVLNGRWAPIGSTVPDSEDQDTPGRRNRLVERVAA